MIVMMECNIILDRAYSCRELVTTTKEHYERYLKPFCKVLERDEITEKVGVPEPPVQDTIQTTEPVEAIDEQVEVVEEKVEDTEPVEKATESPKNKMSHSGKKK